MLIIDNETVSKILLMKDCIRVQENPCRGRHSSPAH